MPYALLRNVKLRSKEKKNTKNNGGLQAIILEFGKTKAHQHRISFCHTDDYSYRLLSKST